jgi:hypothetical protein
MWGLTLLEHSGPVKACNGIALPYIYTYINFADPTIVPRPNFNYMHNAIHNRYCNGHINMVRKSNSTITTSIIEKGYILQNIN